MEGLNFTDGYFKVELVMYDCSPHKRYFSELITLLFNVTYHVASQMQFTINKLLEMTHVSSSITNNKLLERTHVPSSI